MAAEQRQSMESWARRPVRGEKAQVQALDRTQPLLPMRSGQPERRTPDYLLSVSLSAAQSFLHTANASEQFIQRIKDSGHGRVYKSVS
jgi:hypothetical protein